MQFYNVEYLERKSLPICNFCKQHNFLTSLPSNSESLKSEFPAFAVMFTINAGFGCQAWLHSMSKLRWHVERWSKDVAYARNIESGCNNNKCLYSSQDKNTYLMLQLNIKI